MIIQLCGHDVGLEPKFLKKLDIMSDRVSKKSPRLDACLENAGYEGTGKTNASIIEAAYVKEKTKRPISLFFKTSSCLKFAQNTKEQIIILDEPSFESLSTDQTTLNKDFLRLVTTMREKRHFLIINFAKFWKFPDFLVIDRALGMVHLYLRKGKSFRFSYIRQKKLQTLWDIRTKTKKLIYNKLKSFGGSFPYVMEDLWEELDIRVENIEHSKFSDYLAQRDLTVQGIGTQKISKKEQNELKKLNELRYRITLLYKKGLVSMASLAQVLQINERRIREWTKIDINDEFSLRNVDFDPMAADINKNSGVAMGVDNV